MTASRHEDSVESASQQSESGPPPRRRVVRWLFTNDKDEVKSDRKRSLWTDGTATDEADGSKKKSSWGILADPYTDRVPGTVKLLAHSVRNEPLGEDKMEHHAEEARSPQSHTAADTDDDEAKRTADGKIVLNPQPEDTPNDPLNWPAWRRDCALLSLGFYCMLGGGMTPVLAAGFNQVAATFEVTFSKVALTTGLYMMGLGVGSVVASPTAILFGKRPVYLVSSILFVLASVWCALAPDYANLVVARVVQGIAVSPVECLPSATIAEIFFLHERAFRVGIYTLLLLGGKNLIPLVSAAIIQAKGWRWVFWVVAMVIGLGGALLFFFVPETFWDRTPRPRQITRPYGSHSTFSLSFRRSVHHGLSRSHTNRSRAQSYRSGDEQLPISPTTEPPVVFNAPATDHIPRPAQQAANIDEPGKAPDDGTTAAASPNDQKASTFRSMPTTPVGPTLTPIPIDGDGSHDQPPSHDDPRLFRYTSGLRQAPALSYTQTLKPWNGRLTRASWLKVAVRPFILYAYPAVLWSSLVYALSVGWLIVLSEAVAHVYETRATYNFSSIQVGLVYISPFVGGVLGTAVAGRVSDIIVRYMARHNQGIYEPEYRLVMGIPIALCTSIGLMGFGWSAQEKDNFMVPTVFFGIISFGCCMGSTTAITYCVDSYRQFAGEALVTLNFSKNILHGLVWSLFFPQWLQADGPKTVFLAIGGIQMACLLATIPMYIYGKRARMWTVRVKMMERF